jgi:hypothetical protein
MTVRNRRLLAVLCIVVLFAAAMAPLKVVSPASICAVLVALPALFGTVVSVSFAPPEPVQLRSSHTAAPLPSRAPPLA